MNRVYIILLNWNGWRDTVECIESLLLLEYPNFRIVLCDNGSNDGSLDKIKDWANRRSVRYFECQRTLAESGVSERSDAILTLISNGENLGFAGGNNVGIRYAITRKDGYYFWLLNNDTVVKPDALIHLVARMQEQSSIGICGSTILSYNNRRRIQALGGGQYCRWIGLPWHYGRFRNYNNKINYSKAESRINYVEGASMLVSRSFLEKVGLMCEDYFLYFEEADWAIRAQNYFKLGYAPESIVYHKVGASIGTNSNPSKKSYTSDYYNIKNRLLFTRRFYPAALPTVLMVIFTAFILRLLIGQWGRAAMILRLVFGVQPEHRA
ncbi:MAG: glycosyltransferase family 2 protein [Desulfuromonadaceae bacterium]|nr:glycosyltransferase family 2 protein [Desulfuromonadaceae bacterium]MDD2854099.1 glycosyltransferase family 2 protein [Desulfuromonadaceae bacterium]